ncbi:MAG TPA: CPBP family intramembrane glutamic endopeptidase [Thermoanaerobaculia bacterium]|nr:CPBP family intramembrane glutamic endopeptidase [Thermoanaerobaculia bacterium]
MSTSLKWAIAGVAIAIAVTTAMDANGLLLFSALPLFPLAFALCIAQRIRPREASLTLGRPHHYVLALLHPVVVIGAITILAIAFGAVHAGAIRWKPIAINGLAGVIAVMLTEEGFFRGWLWAALKRGGLSERGTLVWSSAAFVAWHISAVVFDTGFNPHPAQIPLYLVNAFVMGAIWGLLRSISGSILVSSLCHSVWNAIVYSLYGFGTKTGALGIADTSIFAPEVGVLGLAFNLVFAAALAVYSNRIRLRE